VATGAGIVIVSIHKPAGMERAFFVLASVGRETMTARGDRSYDPHPEANLKRWWTRLFATTLVAAAIGTGAAWAGFAWLEARLPDVFSFDSYKRIALESTRVYASGGELIARFGPENRTVVPQQRIPKTMLYAAVCAEDASFFNHPGLDVAGIARALWVDVTEGRYAQGASTITQQFAKTRYLSREKTLLRKLKELVLARKLEQKLSKNDILALYLNEIYFGHGRYGVEEAARLYFGKPIAQVDLAEAALLAGLINGPERLSPYKRPDLAFKRRAYVLDQMARRGYITAADADRAGAEPIPSAVHAELDMEAPYYVSEVRRRLRSVVPAARLRKGGLRVDVAMDASVQSVAQDAVVKGLVRIDKAQKNARPLRHYKSEANLAAGRGRLTRAWQAGGKQKYRAGRIALGVVVRRDAKNKRYDVDLGGQVAWLPFKHTDRYRTDGKRVRYRRGDLVRVTHHSARKDKSGKQISVVMIEQGPQAALVALEPKSRLVRALVGGDRYENHRFNRAVHGLRQPGSTFKTFVYGAAIEAGIATADTEFTDSRKTYVSGGRPWTPRNYSGRWDDDDHTLREALARSINSIAVAVADKVGPKRIADFARRVGINSRLRPDLPLALGASSVRPLELTNAYATIAAGGMHDKPIFVTRVLGREGEVLYRAQQTPKRVISADVSRALTDMLGEVVRRGSARKARVNRPVAGKTGTSNGGRDAWFTGFSSQLCATVWVGHDDRKPMTKGSGSRLALPIWADFMRRSLHDVPVLPLPRLPHVLAEDSQPDDTDPEIGAIDIDDDVLEKYSAQL